MLSHVNVVGLMSKHPPTDSRSDKENGALRVVPRSHRKMLQHEKCEAWDAGCQKVDVFRSHKSEQNQATHGISTTMGIKNDSTEIHVSIFKEKQFC